MHKGVKDCILTEGEHSCCRAEAVAARAAAWKAHYEARRPKGPLSERQERNLGQAVHIRQQVRLCARGLGQRRTGTVCLQRDNC